MMLCPSRPVCFCFLLSVTGSPAAPEAWDKQEVPPPPAQSPSTNPQTPFEAFPPASCDAQHSSSSRAPASQRCPQGRTSQSRPHPCPHSPRHSAPALNTFFWSSEYKGGGCLKKRLGKQPGTPRRDGITQLNSLLLHLLGETHGVSAQLVVPACSRLMEFPSPSRDERWLFPLQSHLQQAPGSPLPSVLSSERLLRPAQAPAP